MARGLRIASLVPLLAVLLFIVSSSALSSPPPQGPEPPTLVKKPFQVTLDDPSLLQGRPLLPAEGPVVFGATTIKSEDFEGSWPGDWTLYEGGADDYEWNQRNCQAYGGSYSGWAVGGGTDGDSLDCGSDYPNDAYSWMIYGPFSLADASDAGVDFYLWLNSESGGDYLYYLASVNGSVFSGSGLSGDSGGWVPWSFDLTNVSGLGNLCGEPNVWIAFLFLSDSGNTYPEGAYVDDIDIWMTGATPADIDISPTTLNFTASASSPSPSQSEGPKAPSSTRSPEVEELPEVGVTCPPSGCREAQGVEKERGLGMIPTTPGKYPYIPPPLPERVMAMGLPTSVDLSGGMPPIGDQGTTPSCVGWSSSYYYKTYQERREHGNWEVGTNGHQYSTNYVWNQLEVGGPGECAGAMPGDAMALIADDLPGVYGGDASFAVFPWVTGSLPCKLQPTVDQANSAANWKASTYSYFWQENGATWDTINDMKAWLAGGDPLVMGILVTSEFDAVTPSDCVVGPPGPGSTSRGGHAIAIVGYDDTIGSSGAFKFVNSWGTGYGCSGYGWLTYEFVLYGSPCAGVVGAHCAMEAWWMTDEVDNINARQPFTVYNTGATNLSVTGITEETGSAWLSTTPPLPYPFSVSGEGSQVVLVDVDPTGLSAGPYSDRLLVASNDPDENPYPGAVYVNLQVGPSPSPTPTPSAYIYLPLVLKNYP